MSKDTNTSRCNPCNPNTQTDFETSFSYTASMSGKLVVAIPTFVASSLSFLGTAAIAVLYWLAPPSEPHPRHYMVLSLLLSGKDLEALNLFAADFRPRSDQLSEQYHFRWLCTICHLQRGWARARACLYCKRVHRAIHSTSYRFQHPSDVDRRPSHSDESIHIFATKPQIHCNALLGSLDSICNYRYAITSLNRTNAILMQALANIALGLHAYGPTSGNWCWITPKHIVLRYALTHGWRIAIFLTTICIYTYVYIRLTRTYGNIWARTHESRATEEESQLCPISLSSLPDTPTTTKGDTGTRSYNIELRQNSTHKTAAISTVDTNGSQTLSNRTKELRRFLLLNGYPILWILLWIPGMANRACELTGRSPTWLQSLQATTQLVGLANVLTYAFTEKFVERLRRRFGRTSGFLRTR